MSDKPGKFFRIAFTFFYLAIAFSLVGTLALKAFPSLMSFFAPVFDKLVKGPTWVYMGILPFLPFSLYLNRVGWSGSILFLFWGALIGLIAELAGTQTGLPFGEYAYTGWLGPKIADHVPYFIPLSWYSMSILSYDLAGKLKLIGIRRVLVTALYMILWDVCLDPAMTSAFPFWYYPQGGFLYTMPMTNWFGWFVTSLVIAAGYEWLTDKRPNASFQWVYGLWMLNALFPIALSFLYELWTAVLIGIPAMLIPYLAHRSKNAD